MWLDVNALPQKKYSINIKFQLLKPLQNVFAIVLSVLFRFTDSDYPFGIF